MLYTIKDPHVDAIVPELIDATDTVLLMNDGVLIERSFAGDVYAIEEDCRLRGITQRPTVDYTGAVDLIADAEAVVNWR